MWRMVHNWCVFPKSRCVSGRYRGVLRAYFEGFEGVVGEGFGEGRRVWLWGWEGEHLAGLAGSTAVEIL